jgi:tetratricopeptide (TPR) repeat protein
MIIQDPGGLLQRIPELKPLCEDAGVRRAVERGDPFRLYRALFWARWMGRLRSHRELIEALLSRRRLFARPLRGNISLGRVNGFGMTLLGAAEPDPEDGTSIATHCFVALFIIPLLPLGAYVVRPAEGSDALNRGWTLFAQVPLGLFPWLYSRAVALSVLALVVFGGAQAFIGSRYQDVHLINGFQEPLSVELAGRTELIPPRDRRVVSVPVGPQRGRAVSQGGVEVDVVDLNVRSSSGVFAWNIAGAAPVFLERVTYTSSSTPAPSGDKPKLYCGQRVLALGHVDYAFVEPPSSLRMKGNGRTVRSYVDVVREVPDNIQLCTTALGFEDRLADALPLAEANARLKGWDQESASLAVRAALEKDPAEAVRVARAAVEARPEDVELHRLLQWAAEQAGQLEPLRSEYRARAEAQPDSATAQYLYARLQRGHAGAAAMEQLAQRFPKESRVLRAVIYSRWKSGDWQGTLKAWEVLRSQDASAVLEMTEAEVTALVALGRRGEALSLLEQLFPSAQGRARFDIAELYARIARAEKGATPDTLITAVEATSQLQEGEKLWSMRARADLPIEGAPDAPGFRFVSLVGKDPQAAIAAAARLKNPDLLWMGSADWALAYGEAVRTGEEPTEKVLGRARRLDPTSMEVFRRFVRGEQVSLEEAELTPELRAAACFVRSRNAALPREERRKLVEQARRDDWFQGKVSEAIASWAP